MLWFPVRSSSHAAWTPPKRSIARSGIHWRAVVASSFTRTAGDHVVPPSEEWEAMMSMSPFGVPPGRPFR